MRMILLLLAPVLVAQAPLTTATVRLTAPDGWEVQNTPGRLSLTAPEKDLRVHVLEASAPNASAALAAAWTSVDPAMKRPVRTTNALPAREGWEERHQTVYETSPNEKRNVIGMAMRAGKQWTAVLVDGGDAAMEKRGSQLGLLISSVRPKDYARESFANRKALALTPERIEQLKAFVRTAMDQLGIPGAGLALIDKNQIVYEGGLGVRELGKQAPVDANTLFMAASNTKGMTTLLLSTLADEKKLRWDQPVIEVYPPFKLGDTETTKSVLVRHLVCACTGLPRQDFEWIFESGKATPASSMALLGTMKPTSKFGEVFQYSNLMATAAGYVGAALYAPGKELGAAYDEAMEKRIFGPLGMHSTTFDMAKAQRGNYARPHADDVDGHPARAAMGFNNSIVPHRPAGGVWTSAHDLIRYVQLELNKGKLPNGKQLVSEENLLKRREPQIAAGEDRFYGMGLSINKGTGVTVVHHGGSMVGYKSDILFLPDHGVGAVILTNSDNGGALLGPFQRRLMEILFDGKPEAAENVQSSAQRMRANLAKERARMTIPPAPADAAVLASRYQSKELGEIVVTRNASGVKFDFGEWNSQMATRKNDDGTTSFLTIDPGPMGLEFVVTGQERPARLITRDAQHEYVFTPTASSR